MAGPSHFRLERVRALRERSEDLARERLAASLADRLRGAATLAAVDDRLRAAHDAQRDGAGELVDATALQALQGWREHVELVRQDAARDLDRRDLDVCTRRGELTEASRDREALERLKVRAEARHALEERRADSAATDEIALAMHHRRGSAA